MKKYQKPTIGIVNLQNRCYVACGSPSGQGGSNAPELRGNFDDEV